MVILEKFIEKSVRLIWKTQENGKIIMLKATNFDMLRLIAMLAIGH